MTSKINIVIPACLLSLLVSMAFFNVAYADEPIWRESNNLYNSQIIENYNQNATGTTLPYRLYFLQGDTSLQGGETYSFSFEKNSSILGYTSLVVSIDGERVVTGYNQNTQFTFEVPEDYQYIDIFMSSRDYIPSSAISKIMLNEGNPLPYEPYYSGFRFDFAAIATSIGQYVQPVLTTILPYIFLMIALIIGINAGVRVFRKTAT